MLFTGLKHQQEHVSKTATISKCVEQRPIAALYRMLWAQLHLGQGMSFVGYKHELGACTMKSSMFTTVYMPPDLRD